MPVIYADVLVALNWLVDFLLLSATACLLHLPPHRVRLTLASFLGGLYALVLLLPPLPSFIRLMIDLAVSALMTLVAFSRYRWKAILKQTLAFFAVSTVFSGVVSVMSRLFFGEYVWFNNGTVYADISPLMLAIFAVFSYIVVRVFERVTRKRMPTGGEYHLTIRDDAATFEGRVLCDTGLHLREPFSGAPVIVMEREKALVCVSEDVKTALEEMRAHPRVRMIPYRTVAGGGLLPAFCPRSIQLKRLGETKRDISGTYVALCNDLGRGEYDALIGNDCCEGWDK